MKIQITKKNIIITPPPKRDKKNGLKVWFWREPRQDDITFPIATTDLKKGQSKYTLPEEMICAIKGIEF